MSLRPFGTAKYSPELKYRAAAELELRSRAQPRTGVGVEWRGAAAAAQTITARRWIISGPFETGKTWAALYRLDSEARAHPKAQYALVRKVRNDMDGTVLVTWRKIIAMRGGVGTFGGEKVQFYDYPNGARVWVGGLDRPEKTLSGERDGIYVNQTEELDEADWEMLTRSTTGRGAVTDHPMLFGDCNPGPEDHWIIQRRDAGQLVMLESKHEDNPTLYDAGQITEQGRLTMADLDSMTGARYWRGRMGIWVGAEGQHFEAWDEKRHVIEPPYPQITGDWLLWGALDYGFAHPLASGVLGLDPLGNVHLMAEWGGRKTLIPDHVVGYMGMIGQLGVTNRVRFVAAGHDAWATRGGDDAETIADKWARAVQTQLGYDALPLERATIDRVNGAAAIQERLGNAARVSSLYIWRQCHETIRTIPRMVTDPRNAEDVKKLNADAQGRGGDDYYDMLRYGVMAAPSAPPVSLPAVGGSRALVQGYKPR
jgi:hypothetical protein